MTSIATRPEKEFKVGAVRAAIWANERHAPDGKTFNSHKVLVDRVYKDNQGDFKTTSSLEANDIPKAILALKKAYEYLTLTPTKNRDAKPEPSPSPDLAVPDRIP